MNLNNLVELLRIRAESQGSDPLFTFLGDGEVETTHLTYGQLDVQARVIGAQLQKLGMSGERVLLNFPPGLDFISAFFGCLYAGVVAVPVPLVSHPRKFSRVQKILDDAGAKVILTTEPLLAKLKGNIGEASRRQPLVWLATDTLSGACVDHWHCPIVKSETLAYLQYTSGSTGDPKGVMVTHGNVLHNLAYTEQEYNYSPESLSVSWLPHFHDMGLILGILQPLYEGCRSVLFPPLSFVQRPIRWLRVISRYQGTHSGGPNFAYDLCVRKISHDERKTLDLQSWQVTCNGAEPIHHDTLLRFAEIFEPNGFRWKTFCPAYGLAESTLIVSNTRQAAEPVSTQVDESNESSNSSRAVVSCGRVGFGMNVRIVDPETGCPCPRHTIGEIWVSGPSVTKGYWKREQETQHTFHAFLADESEGPFLRTGDLGFFQDEELFVTGRLKDLIIIRGSNYAPQDIERTVEQSHPLLASGSRVAFSVEKAGEERLVVVQDVGRTQSELELQDLTSSIRQAVADEHVLQIYELVFVKPRGVPKTSSGKIQRQACRLSYLKGELPVVRTSVLDIPDLEEGDGLQDWERLLSLGEGDSKNGLISLLQEHIARQIGLRPSEVNVHDSLINLGLESLMAMDLKSLLEDRLGVEIPLSRFLFGVTLEELAEEVYGQPWIWPESRQEYGHINVEVESEHPLSHGQEALWFLQRMDPDNVAYNVKFVARIVSDCDVKALERSARALINRHPSLRTTFQDCHGRPVQKVQAFQESQVQIVQTTGWNAQNVQEYLEWEAHRPVDLVGGPVFRVVFLPQTKSNVIMLMASHHIVMDLWSMAVLMDEFKTLYTSEQSGLQALLPPLKASYVGFVRWQTDWLASSDGDRQLAYWKNQLGGELSTLRLPTEHPRPVTQSYRGASYFFEVNEKLTEGLKALAQAQGATLYVLLLAAFQVLLSRYSGQNDVVVGSPCAGRTLPKFEGTIGYFVNTVVMRGRFSDHQSFSQFLQQTRTVVLDALDHQDYPFPLLVEHLQPERDPSMSPLYQVMFVLEKPHRLEKEGLSAFILGDKTRRMTLGDLVMEPIAIKEQAAQVDLTLIMAEVDNSLQASIQYNADLFNPSTVERMAGHFLTVIEGLVVNPEESISTLPLLSELERHHLLVDWNKTQVDFSNDQCAHQLFEAQVERTPDASAVAFEGQQLTYRELNQRANQVAHYLRRLGVGPEVLVGMCMERSLKMVVGLLGILKAGGAYVPLDPALPQDRLSFMLQDTQAHFVLASKGVVVPRMENQLVMDLDSDWQLIAQESVEYSKVSVASHNLAYILYTSGTTGRPKGVMIEHRGLANMIQEQFRLFDLPCGSRVLQFASLSFDASLFEFTMALTRGATLVLGTEDALLPGRPLLQFLRDERITAATLPPSVLETLPFTHLPDLHVLNVAGEACPQELVDRWSEGCGFFNLYGPTEATIWATFARCSERNVNPSIGRPIGNVQIYILDRGLQPVPIGVAGEVYIGGMGLARGYVNLPEQTRERFISNPFQAGTRLYKTGDSAKYLPNGDIEFLGRIDHQVKIRGFRIEIEEIEAVLSQHSDVREVVVGVREGTGKRKKRKDERTSLGPSNKNLVAYIVPALESKLVAQELRRFLQQKLPAYMIPTVFATLNVLPRLPTGKVDRQALRVSESALLEDANHLISPRNSVENGLVEIWREVLGVEPISIDDNFFELGGHSLLVTQICSRVWDMFQVELPLRSLFEQPTVAELATCITATAEEGKNIQSLPIVSVPREGESPLSFSQERMWFLYQLESGGPAYSIPFAVHLSGLLNIRVLEQCINDILKRHEVLRTAFKTVEGQPVQVIHPALHLPLQAIDFQALPQEKRNEECRRLARAEAQIPFDLGSAPLLRATVYRLASTDHVLFLNMHHIVSDAWSMNIFLEELVTLYRATNEHRPSPLVPLTLQYADFALWQRHGTNAKLWEYQLDYWKKQLSGCPMFLEIPTDRPRPSIQGFEGRRVTFTISKELTLRLNEVSRQERVTVFMTLLAAFEILLSRYSGQDEFLVGVPIAGRNREEVTKIIGLFSNTLALRADLSGSPSFTELLAQVRRVALEAFANQDLPFEQVVTALHPERTLSHSPLFQVMFSYEKFSQGGRTFSEEIPGLALTPMNLEQQTAKFDLTVFIEETNNGLNGAIEYRTDLFEEETIRRMVGHFEVLLQGIVADPRQSVASLPLLTSEERQQVLVEWNATDQPYPNRCFQDLIEEQVVRTPNEIAVTCEDCHLTYDELNQRANRVAHYLRKAGVGPDVFVGIYLNRSIDMMVGLLGVLKAGGAYVPLDLSYPRERLRLIMAESQMAVLFTQKELREKLPSPFQHPEVMGEGAVGACDSDLKQIPSGSFPQVVCLDAITDKLAQESADNLLHVTTPDNLAYVIYTSGSTGTPKGVMIPHRGLVNYLLWCIETYDVKGGRGSLVHSSIAFDMAVTSLFAPLLVGKSVTLLPETAGVDTLSKALVDQPGWSFLKLTPSHLEMLAHRMPQRDRCVNRLLVGGEILRGHTINTWRSRDPDATVINEYGPTEAVVGCCVYEVPKYEVAPEAQPIGRPISNVQLYILDQCQQPVPIGVPGELYIGGHGVARGYVSQPELTQQMFIPNPFVDDSRARLYKTGDRCRYRADGTIEFLGRVDRLVKLRGFRVELGEIESILSRHQAVQEAVVVLNEQIEHPSLIAYTVPSSSCKQTVDGLEKEVPLNTSALAAELQAFLHEWVPPFMIPSTFLWMDGVPLTSNGKIDYQALEKIHPVPSQAKDAFVPPSDTLEAQLVNLWEAALGMKPISVQDNFFDLGGHSLLAVRLWARMESLLGKVLPLSLLYRAPTIAQLAQVIRQQGGAAQWEYLVEVQPGGSRPPLFIVPGAGGTGLYLRDFAKHLGNDQPLYAFVAQGLDGKKPFHTSVEEMARHYVTEMRRLQPEGPYFLSGHSFGGLVAIEMGQQLQQMGQPVDLLALFDTPGPAFQSTAPIPPPKPLPTYRKTETFNSRIRRHVRNLMKFSWAGRREYIGTRLESLGRHWWSRKSKKAVPFVCYRFRALGIPVPLILRSDYMCFVTSEEVKAAYKVRPYTGPLTIFQVGQTSSGQKGLGWKEVAWGGLEVKNVAGGHGDLLNDPYAEGLAITLKDCLKKAQEDSKEGD